MNFEPQNPEPQNMEKQTFSLMQLVKEPLVHFLLLGSGLFLIFHLMGEPNAQNPDRIVITRGKIENLRESFKKRWLRLPSGPELKGLVNDYIKEEVLYREALAMGLDKNDTVVRRRMRQKMRFLFEDVASQAEPSDEELQTYLEQNAAYFRTESRFTFIHVFLSPKRRGEALQADAENFLEMLNGSPGDLDFKALGDPTMLSRLHEDVSLSDVDAIFGQGFARSMSEVPPGRWQGPIPSAYGMHLVLVRNRVEGRDPTLEEVRDTVMRELQNARRKEVNEATYQRLLERYTVVVEQD